MLNITPFDSTNRYIFLSIQVLDVNGRMQSLRALLDTGAPSTELSDDALQQLGFLPQKNQAITLKSGLQTQKYGRVILPKIEICGHCMFDLPVYVSYFDKSWGIKALIGLDFFRSFKTTIDYSQAALVTEALKIKSPLK